MKISTASIYDLSALIRLEKDCFSSPWKEKDLVFALRQSWQTLLIAKDDEGREIGYGIFSSLPGEWEVIRLGVSLSFRGKGVGKALMRSALTFFAESGGGRMLLEVRASNTPALRLYERLGFSIYGTRPRYYNNPIEDAVCMEKCVLPEKEKE